MDLKNIPTLWKDVSDRCSNIVFYTCISNDYDSTWVEGVAIKIFIQRLDMVLKARGSSLLAMWKEK